MIGAPVHSRVPAVSVILAAAAALLVSATNAPQFRSVAAQANSPRDILLQAVQADQIAGAVAGVFRDDRLISLDVVGVQDLESRTPMTERSIFRIYSMTKPVTAVAAMMLYEQGRFALSDPVAKYLPDFAHVFVQPRPDLSARPPQRAMTIDDLLLHASGLSHRTSDLYRTANVRSRAVPLSRFIENIVKAPLLEDPGTRFRYSEATTVVGRLIEIWSRQPLDVFMAERVFKPLRMMDTDFWVPPEKRDRFATVYGPAATGALAPVEMEDVPFTERPALLEGAVGLVSTVPDYLRFSRMLLNRGELDGVRLLRAETVDRITRNALSPEVMSTRRGGTGWALANVEVVVDPARVAYPADVGEYGWDGTAGTVFWVNPKRRTIAILMTQRSPYNPARLHERFKASVEQTVR